MVAVLLALCAMLAWSCGRSDAPREPERTPQELAEHPCVGAWGGGPALFLRIDPDGRYESFQFSSGVCLDDTGNGSSSGTWRAEGEGAGLVLVLGEQRLSLRSSSF